MVIPIASQGVLAYLRPIDACLYSVIAIIGNITP